jgi:N utilization substance protein B
MLFLWDMRRQSPDESSAAYYDIVQAEESAAAVGRDSFADALLSGVVTNLAELDQAITRHAQHWRIERMATVDRNVLRMAVYEMMRMDTPPPVAIDEAIELARRFSNEESAQFVNGVLDAIKREIGPAAGGVGR